MAENQPCDVKIAKTVEMESALLGGILLDEGIGIPTLAHALNIVEPEDFYLTQHQRIYQAILEQHAGGKPIDFVTVYSRVSDLPFQAFFNLKDMALPGHVGHFAHRIKDACRRRKAQAMLKEAHEILGMVGDVDLESQVNSLSEEMLALIVPERKDETIGGPGLIALLKEMELGERNDLVETGLRSVDLAMGSLRPGRSIIIAGRTSMGKTSMATTIALNVARSGKACVFVNIEGDNRDLRQRLLSIISDVPISRIVENRFKKTDVAKIAQASSELDSLPIYPIEGKVEWAKIKAQITLKKFEHPEVKVVFVDYLGKIRAEGIRNRWDEVGFISREFKWLCQTLNVAGVMLCQINREPEKRKNSKPHMGDLRDSGSVEQDADVVVLLFRPYYYDKNEDSTSCELIIAKNRTGPTGTVEISFDGLTGKFSDQKIF